VVLQLSEILKRLGAMELSAEHHEDLTLFVSIRTRNNITRGKYNADIVVRLSNK
jgi:uncharacterized membrane protein